MIGGKLVPKKKENSLPKKPTNDNKVEKATKDATNKVEKPNKEPTSEPTKDTTNKLEKPNKEPTNKVEKATKDASNKVENTTNKVEKPTSEPTKDASNKVENTTTTNKVEKATTTNKVEKPTSEPTKDASNKVEKATTTNKVEKATTTNKVEKPTSESTKDVSNKVEKHTTNKVEKATTTNKVEKPTSEPTKDASNKVENLTRPIEDDDDYIEPPLSLVEAILQSKILMYIDSNEYSKYLSNINNSGEFKKLDDGFSGVVDFFDKLLSNKKKIESKELKSISNIQTHPNQYELGLLGSISVSLGSDIVLDQIKNNKYLYSFLMEMDKSVLLLDSAQKLIKHIADKNIQLCKYKITGLKKGVQSLNNYIQDLLNNRELRYDLELIIAQLFFNYYENNSQDEFNKKLVNYYTNNKKLVKKDIELLKIFTFLKDISLGSIKLFYYDNGKFININKGNRLHMKTLDSGKLFLQISNLIFGTNNISSKNLQYLSLRVRNPNFNIDTEEYSKTLEKLMSKVYDRFFKPIISSLYRLDIKNISKENLQFIRDTMENDVINWFYILDKNDFSASINKSATIQEMELFLICFYIMFNIKDRRLISKIYNKLLNNLKNIKDNSILNILRPRLLSSKTDELFKYSSYVNTYLQIVYNDLLIGDNVCNDPLDLLYKNK
jgi:hypothetical protein